MAPDEMIVTGSPGDYSVPRISSLFIFLLCFRISLLISSWSCMDSSTSSILVKVRTISFGVYRSDCRGRESEPEKSFVLPQQNKWRDYQRRQRDESRSCCTYWVLICGWLWTCIATSRERSMLGRVLGAMDGTNERGTARRLFNRKKNGESAVT